MHRVLSEPLDVFLLKMAKGGFDSWLFLSSLLTSGQVRGAEQKGCVCSLGPFPGVWSSTFPAQKGPATAGLLLTIRDAGAHTLYLRFKLKRHLALRCIFVTLLIFKKLPFNINNKIFISFLEYKYAII
jgi:hypothetical protein